MCHWTAFWAAAPSLAHCTVLCCGLEVLPKFWENSGEFLADRMSWQAKHFYAFGPFRLDPEERLLLRDGRPVPLAPKVTETLFLLVQNAGHLVDKDELMKRVWPDAFVEEGNLNKNIFLLRKVLGQWDGGLEYIETVPKRGYRFVAAVNQVMPEASTKAPSSSGASLIGKKVSVRRDKLNSLVLTAAISIVLLGTLEYRLRAPAPRILEVNQLTNDGQEKFLPLLSDGTRLYFNMPSQAGWAISEISATGGEIAPLVNAARGSWLDDLSPNGSELLISHFGDAGIRTDTPLFILPIPSGVPRRIGEVLAHAASWSPDGGTIVYGRGHDVFVVKPDGSQDRKLVTLNGYARWLRWSPDGALLRLTLYDEKTGLSALWEVRADGTHLHPLLAGWNKPSSECCGNWTADGRYFVFESDRNGESDLWVLREKTGLFRARSGEPMPLTTGPMGMSGFVMSKDGNQLFAIGTSRGGEVVRYDRKYHQFLPYLPRISAVHLTFSRDGEWMAYVSYPDRVLWRSRVDGSERLRLSPPSMQTLWPKWSPNGKQIAFAGQIPGQQPFHIYLVSPEGTGLQAVSPGKRDEIPPSWSPDGKMLVYGNWIDKNGETEGIHLLDLRTHQVTSLPGSLKKTWFPLWSPDGSSIVALTVDQHKLMLFDVKAQKWNQLGNVRVDRPSWSRDGKYVYFDSTFEGNAGFYRIRTADGKLERVADLGGLKRMTEGGFGSWTGLAHDDSPLALRDISSYEVYAFNLQLP
jgi:Tol biopolymer transport system component/DNA-binding winged helix-turn-helix (wHTH) protein